MLPLRGSIVLLAVSVFAAAAAWPNTASAQGGPPPPPATIQEIINNVCDNSDTTWGFCFLREPDNEQDCDQSAAGLVWNPVEPRPLICILYPPYRGCEMVHWQQQGGQGTSFSGGSGAATPSALEGAAAEEAAAGEAESTQAEETANDPFELSPEDAEIFLDPDPAPFEDAETSEFEQAESASGEALVSETIGLEEGAGAAAAGGAAGCNAAANEGPNVGMLSESLEVWQCLNRGFQYTVTPQSVLPEAKGGIVGSDPPGYADHCQPSGWGRNSAYVDENGINVATGEFSLRYEYLQIPGKGLDYSFSLTYRSLPDGLGLSSFLGLGWDHRFFDRITTWFDCDCVEFTGGCSPGLAEDGIGYVRITEGNVRYFFPDAVGSNLHREIGQGYDRLLDVGSELVLRTPEGTTYHYFPMNGNAFEGRLKFIEDRNGNRITCQYATFTMSNFLGETLPVVLLTKVIDTYGRVINYVYNSDGLLARVTDYLGRSIFFTYKKPGTFPTVSYPVAAAAILLSEIKSPAVTTGPSDNLYPAGKRTRFHYNALMRFDVLAHKGGTKPFWEAAAEEYAYVVLSEVVAADGIGAGEPLDMPFMQVRYDCESYRAVHVLHGDVRQIEQILENANAKECREDFPIGSGERADWETQQLELMNQAGGGVTTYLASPYPNPLPCDIALYEESLPHLGKNADAVQVQVVDSAGRHRLFIINNSGEVKTIIDKPGRIASPIGELDCEVLPAAPGTYLPATECEEPCAWMQVIKYNFDGQIAHHLRTNGNVLENVYDGLGNLSRSRLYPEHEIVVYQNPTPGPYDRDTYFDFNPVGDYLVLSASEYEPIFSQAVRTYDPRDQSVRDPDLTVSPFLNANIATEFTLDYQEAATLAPALAAILSSYHITGATIPPVPALGAGDVNADGTTAQGKGNVVRTRHPTATLPAGLVGGTSQQSSTQEAAYNVAGQLVYQVDAEGVSTSYEYYPFTDPDGDGTPVPPTTPPTTPHGSGYRLRMIEDSGIVIPGKSPLRPGPAGGGTFARATVYNYDVAGNRTRETDALGRIYQSFFNQRNQRYRTLAPTPFLYETLTYYDVNDKVMREEYSYGESDLAGNPATAAALPNAAGEIVSIAKTVKGFQYYFDGQMSAKQEGYKTTAGAVVWERTHSYYYNKDRKLVREVDFEGNVTDYCYNSRDLLFYKIVGNNPPAGQSAVPAFDGVGLIPVPVNADASFYYYSYDGNRNLICETDAAKQEIAGSTHGDTTFHTYDDYDRRITTTRPSGTVETISYDIAGNVVRTKTSGEYITHASLTGVLGEYTLGTGLLADMQTEIDERGRTAIATQSIFAPGPEPVTTTGEAITRTFHDRLGAVTRVIDANGNESHTELDRLERVRRAASARAVPGEDPFASAWGLTTNYFDIENRLLEVVSVERRVAGATAVDDKILKVTTNYDVLDRAFRVVDPLGQTARTRYDSRGLALSSTDARGPVTTQTIARISTGEPVAINDHGNRADTLYDTLGRAVRVTRSMTASGEGDGTAAPATAARTYTGDVVGGPPVTNAPVHDPTIETEADYDLLDQVTSRTDDRGKVTLFDYDEHSRLILVTHPDQTIERYEYDRDSLLVEFEDGNGTVTNHTYDAGHRRVLTVAMPPAAMPEVTATEQTFAFDGLDRLVYAFDKNVAAPTTDDHHIFKEYDSVGRVVFEKTDARLLASTYDPAGNKTACEYAGGASLALTFDSVHRVATIAEDGDQVVSYGYAGAGRRVLSRNLRPVVANLQSDFVYDGNNRLTDLSHADSGTSLLHYSYAYHRGNHRIREVRHHETPVIGNAWEYDSASRMLRERREGTYDAPMQAITGGTLSEYWLDGVGNWLFKKVGTGAAHQNAIDDRNAYTEFEEDAVLRDDAGNRTAAGDRSYGYDALHRLREVKDAGVTKATYEYFADGRRAAKDVTGIGKSGYAYDGKRIVEIWNAALGTIQKHFLYGVGVYRVISYTNHEPATPERFLLVEDAIGSTVALCDDTGALVERYQYDAYGMPTVEDAAGVPIAGTASAEGNPFLFAAYYWDAEVEHYYLRARIYDPRQGRFLTIDPIGVWGDMGNLGNGYGYGGCNPINFIDPEGLDFWGWLADVTVGALEVVAGAGSGVLDAVTNGAYSEYVLEPAVDFVHGEGTFQEEIASSKNFQVTHTGAEIVGSFVPTGKVVDLVQAGVGIAQGESVTSAALNVLGGKALEKGVDSLKGLAKSGDEIADAVPGQNLTKQSPNASSNCFAAGTLVHTPIGAVPIEEIEEGDLVYGYDLEAGEVVEREVIEKLKNFTIFWVDIELDNEVVTATRGHRFWIVSKQDWISALDLEAGMLVCTKSGSIEKIWDVCLRELITPEDTYNLEVRDVHNFFVGRTAILAHNGDVDESSAETSSAARREAMRGQGMPTSQQPTEQSNTPKGRQYKYDTPAPGGGTRTSVVTQHLDDPNHGPHWEAGVEKPPTDYGTDSEGRSRHFNNDPKTDVPKTRVTYPGC